MTESLYLALFIWSVVYFTDFVRSMENGRLAGPLEATPKQRSPKIASSSLVKCGLCLAAACLTRYDGWFLAAAMCAATLAVVLKAKAFDQNLRRSLLKFALLAAAAPAVWLAYNAIVYRNPLEFATGQYSARAIEQKSTATTHPGAHDLPVAFSYFLKSAELNMAAGSLQKLWVAVLSLGIAAVLIFKRRAWPLLLLGIPIPFYMLSIAYSGVPLIRANLVAILFLQRALWTSASSIFLCDGRRTHLFVAPFCSEQVTQNSSCFGRSNTDRCELCLRLEGEAGLLRGSRGELPQPHCL